MTFSVGGEMKWKKFSMDATAAYNKRVSSNTIGTAIVAVIFTTW